LKTCEFFVKNENLPEREDFNHFTNISYQIFPLGNISQYLPQPNSAFYSGKCPENITPEFSVKNKKPKNLTNN